jgi:hypothetical protein
MARVTALEVAPEESERSRMLANDGRRGRPSPAMTRMRDSATG